MYASLADARAEGVTEAQASDARVLALLEEATLLIYDLAGNLVQAIRTPPGLYVTEARPIGFGLYRAKPSRNLLLVTFSDRPQGRL